MIYFDLSRGAAADMLCAALMDCGLLTLSSLEKKLDVFDGAQAQINAQKCSMDGISGTKVSFSLRGRKPPDNFEGIKKFVESSSLDEKIKSKVLGTYNIIFSAEGAVHSTEKEKVHLHELADPAKILQITAFHILTEGEEVSFSVPALGSGAVRTSHGEIPIPSPATAEILKGCQVSFSENKKEMVTPSAVALLRTSGSMCRPDMRIEKIGYGIGERSLLRVFTGPEVSSSQGNLVEIDFNLDDMSPEDISFFTEKISNVCVDFYITPVLMKKSRPAHKVSILAEEKKLDTVQEMIFNHTTTSGIRYKRISRIVLERENDSFDSSLGSCRVKKYTLPSGIIKIKPEFEDLKKIAEKNKISITEARMKVIGEYNKNE